jgi:hypothetical protein
LFLENKNIQKQNLVEEKEKVSTKQLENSTIASAVDSQKTQNSLTTSQIEVDQKKPLQLGFFSRMLAPIFLTENEINQIKSSK